MSHVSKARAWLPDATRLLSPNCDHRSSSDDVDLLVIHNISLPPGQYGGDYVDAFFTNTLDPTAHPYFSDIIDLKVSAHLFIRRDGQVTQYVPFTMRAWHAGLSIFCGRASCNDYSIGIELEGCDEKAYTTSQYHALTKASLWLMEKWPRIKKHRIVGHSDIAQGRKTDPGVAFDWAYYLSLL